MNTVNAKEIQNFSKDSSYWWDINGPFKPLHRLNPVRLSYIKQQICTHFGRDINSLNTYKGLEILDIGCGGGLVCEPMARLGGTVTGIDADENAISVAKDHAAENGLEIEYICGSTHDLASSSVHSPAHSSPPSPPANGGVTKGKVSTAESPTASGDSPSTSPPSSGDSPLKSPPAGGGIKGGESHKQYDIVLALEIIEHVDNPDLFVQSVTSLCKPNGIVIFSTLNRTVKSFALGIVAAEYILGWVPKGTHNWKKFVKPSELSRMVRHHGGTPQNICGLAFNPIKDEFHLAPKDLDVNYLMSVKT